MDTKAMHLHLTEEAIRLLDRYCGPRGRGQFISQLIFDYDRAQRDGDGVIAGLREKVADAPASPAAGAARPAPPALAHRKPKRRH